MKFRVCLDSDFDHEEFDYPTEQEAEEGRQRLFESAREHARKDGIVRYVSTVQQVGDEE